MNTKFKIGEQVIYKNKVYYVAKIIINQNTICYQINNNRCIGYEEYTGILERELKKYESILDTAEKRYLKNVIRPFKDRVISIIKENDFGDDYIKIELENGDFANLPNFAKGTMYKGMKKEKKYTLKELELFEEDS